MGTISEVAAGWAVRAAAGALSPDEERELAVWLEADTRHRGAYARARAHWLDLDRLAALNGPAAQPVENPPSRLSRRALLAAGIAAVSVLGVALAWISLRDEREHYASAIGEVRRLPLTDGSTILLNTDSEVFVRLTQERREVDLRRGEALFEVAHDTTRPFIVHANDTMVRAVGTAFAVRLDDAQIDVTVTEGVVELSDAAAMHRVGAEPSAPAVPIRQRVKANERAVIAHAHAPEVEAIEPPQVSRKLAWRDGMVSFDGESLRTAVSEINRHNRRQIVVSDAALGSHPLVGVFRATDIEGFAAAAATTLKARAIVEDDVIRLEPGAAAPQN